MSIKYLKSMVEHDFPNVKIHKLVRPFSFKEYILCGRLGKAHHLYDNVFVKVGAEDYPLFCSTPVKDGKVLIEGVCSSHVFDVNIGRKHKMPDWLILYSSENTINIPRLLNDDYLLAVKLLYNNGLYVSAMKLLLSSIDSVAYIALGKSHPNVFVAWLDSYANLSVLGVTSLELWEFRNGLLHMTNLSSRKVMDGKARKVSSELGTPQGILPKLMGCITSNSCSLWISLTLR